MVIYAFLLLMFDLIKDLIGYLYIASIPLVMIWGTYETLKKNLQTEKRTESIVIIFFVFAVFMLLFLFLITG